VDPREARRRLVAILVAAYSGEQAAALAYAGHWRACRDPEQRERIRRIEDDEWRHRSVVGRMLRRLGRAPSPLRELRARLVGRALGAACRLAGWLLPMYAARRLERSNVCAYDEAAWLAEGCERTSLVPELLAMAVVERDHERYFASKVMSHRLARVLPSSRPLPDQQALRDGVRCP
jgi:demethoxyubiquinone hydroxylase (CLK1/Coq7/Cat5 family)